MKKFYQGILLIILSSNLCFSEGDWLLYSISNSKLPNNLVMDIDAGHNGDIWIATFGGLARFNNNEWEIFNTDNSGLPDDYVARIFKGKNNIMYFSTLYGLAILNNGKWEVLDTENSPLPSNFVTCYYEAENGTIWYGTDNGLAIVEDGNWEVMHTTDSDIPANQFKGIVVDSSQNMWFATKDNGLCKFDGTAWTIFNSDNSVIPDDCFWTIALEGYDSIWVGSSQGIALCIDDSIYRIKDKNDDWYSKRVETIFVDKNRTKWLGTKFGVDRFDGQNWTSYYYQSELPDYDISSIFVDDNNNKWFGTFSGGLAIFNEDEIKLDVEDETKINSKKIKMINYPNPVTEEAIIHFNLPESGQTDIAIYDELGKKQKTILKKYLTKGYYEFEWGSNSLITGTYHCILKVNNIITYLQIIKL